MVRVRPASVCWRSSSASASTSVLSAAKRSEALTQAYAVVGPSASRSASSSAAGSTASGATAALSSPISRACSAVNGSASSSRAAARPAPTSRGSVHDRPESAVSPMPVNAVVKRAPAAPIRKSAAQASPSPAPAAVPFTAATTGLAVSTSAVTTGL